MIFKSALAVLAVSTEGFVVTRPSLLPGTSCLAGDKPYFATQSKEEDISEEEEVEMLVEQEIKKDKTNIQFTKCKWCGLCAMDGNIKRGRRTNPSNHEGENSREKSKER